MSFSSFSEPLLNQVKFNSCIFQPENSGVYTITATNGVNPPATHEVNIEVESAAEFAQTPRDVTMVAGDDHVIVAVITGSPIPDIAVTDQDGNVVPGESQIVQVDENTVRYTLTIPDIQVSFFSSLPCYP